jgi:hypothetical protein
MATYMHKLTMTGLAAATLRPHVSAAQAQAANAAVGFRL